MMETAFDGCEADYGIRSKINWIHPKDGQTFAELHTKRTDGADLIAYAPAGKVTVGSIASIGTMQEIEPHKGERDQIRIRFTREAQTAIKALSEFLATIRKLNEA
jgi:hypothetical protein